MHPGASALGSVSVAAGALDNYLAAAAIVAITAVAVLTPGGPAPSSMAAANSDHIVLVVAYAQPQAIATMTQLTLSVK